MREARFRSRNRRDRGHVHRAASLTNRGSHSRQTAAPPEVIPMFDRQIGGPGPQETGKIIVLPEQAFSSSHA